MRRRIWTKSWFLWLPLLAGLVFACGKQTQDRRAELQVLADSSRFDEIQSRVQVYHEKGEKDPILDYFEGVALLGKDEDLPAGKAFEKAVAADSSLAVVVAQRYREAAQADEKAGWKGRASTRMRLAYLLDGVVEMGDLENDVAEFLYQNKKAKEVIPVLRDLLSKGGSDEDRQRWLFHLGRALEFTVGPEAGLETYRSFWKEFPADKFNQYSGKVSWRQQTVLLKSAQNHMEHEDWEAALVSLRETFDLPPMASTRMQAYYLAGLCEEKRNRPENALKAYEQVLRYQEPGPGGELEKARQRVEALHEAGIR